MNCNILNSKVKSFFVLKYFVILILFNQCLIFKENPIDPNSPLGSLLFFLKISNLPERTITRSEWEFLNSDFSNYDNPWIVRLIEKPSNSILSQNQTDFDPITLLPILKSSSDMLLLQGYNSRFILEQDSFGRYVYEIIDANSGAQLVAFSMDVFDGQGSESMPFSGSPLSQSEFILNMWDYHQSKESEQSPFTRILAIGQERTGEDYFIATIGQTEDGLHPLHYYLVYGKNPMDWKIAKLNGIPSNLGVDKYLQFKMFNLGAFNNILTITEVCVDDFNTQCQESIQSYYLLLPSSGFDRSYDVQIVPRIVANRRVVLLESFVFGSSLVYLTIESGSGNRHYYSSSGNPFLSQIENHFYLGQLNQICSVNFSNPNQLSSFISLCDLDFGANRPIRINPSNEIEFNDPNAFFTPGWSPNANYVDTWIHGGFIYSVVVDFDTNEWNLYRAANPYTNTTNNISEQLYFSRILYTNPIESMPFQPIRIDGNIYTSVTGKTATPNLGDPPIFTFFKVLNTLNNGETWNLVDVPKLNPGYGLYYQSFVMDGKIYLYRISAVGTELYSSDDGGATWKKEIQKFPKLK